MSKKSNHQHANFLTNNLKALLQEKLWLLEDRLQQQRKASSYSSLSNAEAKVLAALRGEALTISEVARRLGVSRQAVHKTVSGLVKTGLLELSVIEGNLRDKSIVFTQAGEQMKEEAENILRKLEDEVKRAIGTQNFQQLKTLLEKEW